MEVPIREELDRLALQVFRSKILQNESTNQLTDVAINDPHRSTYSLFRSYSTHR